MQVDGVLVVSAYSWIQPQSRWDIASLWSFQMLIGRADGPVGHGHHDRQARARTALYSASTM